MSTRVNEFKTPISKRRIVHKLPNTEDPSVRETESVVKRQYESRMQRNLTHHYYLITFQGEMRIMDNHFGKDSYYSPPRAMSEATLEDHSGMQYAIWMLPNRWSLLNKMWSSNNYFGFISGDTFHYRKVRGEEKTHKLAYDTCELIYMDALDDIMVIYYKHENYIHKCIIILADESSTDHIVTSITVTGLNSKKYILDPIYHKLYNIDMTKLLLHDERLSSPFQINNDQIYLNTGKSLVGYDLTGENMVSCFKD